MYTALQTICAALVVGTPPALLVARFLRRGRPAWGLVVLITAIVSSIGGTTLDYLGPYAHRERWSNCAEAAIANPSQPDCPVPSYDVWVLPIYLKWVPGLLGLAASLPFYGLATWLLARYRTPSSAR